MVVTPRCDAMESRNQTRPEVMRDLPLLMNLAVATIDPGGRPAAAGVEGVTSASFCFLVAGPLGLAGGLTSEERSGRVMLCRAGALEVEP